MQKTANMQQGGAYNRGGATRARKSLHLAPASLNMRSLHDLAPKQNHKEMEAHWRPQEIAKELGNEK